MVLGEEVELDGVANVGLDVLRLVLEDGGRVGAVNAGNGTTDDDLVDDRSASNVGGGSLVLNGSREVLDGSNRGVLGSNGNLVVGSHSHGGQEGENSDGLHFEGLVGYYGGF